MSPGEQEELENERDVLTNLTSIKNSLESAISALTGDETNAIDLIDIAIDACDELDGVLDEKEDVPSRLESARIEISDIASTLESLNERLAADPGRLEAVEERLNSIYSLCHKHHLNNGDEILSLRDTLRAKLNDLDNSDDLVAGLEKEARRAKALAKESAIEISNSRKAEAKKFADHLRETAMPLGMKNLQVNIAVEPSELGPTGMDAVEFRFAFNKNQEPIPVGGAASGGEISRIMLSIKSIIANRIELPSIIFDEVDTGVSGDVANRMGLMMLDLAAGLQVIAITHLPQVAAKGKVHFKVFKEDDDLSTHTRMERLTPERRIDELALMLSGSPDDESARHTAGKLLGLS